MDFRKFLLIISIFLTLNCFGQEKGVAFKYSFEFFPLVIPFKIYSAQFVYGFSNKDYFVIGFTYLNNYYPNKKESVGRFYAPTIPIGYRRYLWKNLNIEGQLWPAYDFYKDLTEEKYYKGFDCVGSIRLGYRLDFNIKNLPFYSNIQIEYLFGIYKGNKPKNFDDVESDLPIFPSLSIGYKW